MRLRRAARGSAGAAAIRSRARGARGARSLREAPAFIVYTSGTTGHPKGALVAHGKHLAAATTSSTHYPTLAETRTARSSTCRSATSSAATWRSRCRCVAQLVPHFGEDLGGPAADAVRGRADACSSPCRATCRSSPSQVLVRHREHLERSSAPPTTAAMRVGRAPRARALGGARRTAPRSPTRLRARAGVPRRCSTSSASTSSSWWSPAARRCRPRRWRCGRSGASTCARSTARPRRRARSSPASAGRSRARATSARVAARAAR